MDPAFRLIYILETFLSTVPFGMLRFYAFRRELRISTQVFAFCYTLLVLGKICYLNLAFWPDLLPIEERQRFYLLVSVITNLFFFLIIRPFWRQLFVTGTLMVYATTIMYPFAYIIGNEWLGQGMLAHLAGCIYLLAGIGFTWKPMKHWVTEGVLPFYRYGSVVFWRCFWLIPVLFMFSMVLFGLETADRTLINGAVALASMVGGLGLAASIRFMAYFMEYLYENRLMKDNVSIAEGLYELQLERVRNYSEHMGRIQQLRIMFSRCNEKFRKLAGAENWTLMERELRTCRKVLTDAEKKEQNNDQ